jgi:ATP-dependent Clp protease protease subunit
MKRAYSIKAQARKATIYLYDVIDWMGDNAKAFASDLLAVGEIDEIALHINSPGGDVFDGLAIYNTLLAHKARKVVYIDGVAASIASVIALAGDEIHIAANATVMIHNPWGFAMGDAAEMRKQADLLDKVAESIIGTYATRTGQSSEQIATWMAAETWMGADEAVARGFATHKVEAHRMAAQWQGFNLRAYALKPKSEQQAPELISTPLRDLWESRLRSTDASRK